MKKVFMVHGFMGKPNGGWRPWLMGELAKSGVYACALPMPNPNEPIKNDWVETIKNAIKDPSEDVFIVGHSLGVPAIFRYLETLKDGEKIGAVFLVSGPYEKLFVENKESKLRKIDNFFETSFDFEHIKKVCDNFSIIHNTYDDHVPFSHAESFSVSLDIPITKIERKEDGHLGDVPYCDKLPELLEDIKKYI